MSDLSQPPSTLKVLFENLGSLNSLTGPDHNTVARSQPGNSCQEEDTVFGFWPKQEGLAVPSEGVLQSSFEKLVCWFVCLLVGFSVDLGLPSGEHIFYSSLTCRKISSSLFVPFRLQLSTS